MENDFAFSSENHLPEMIPAANMRITASTKRKMVCKGRAFLSGKRNRALKLL